MPERLVVKNVENALKSAHKTRRRPGEIPYPITYSKDMASFDIWDHMFRMSHFQSLTRHKFEEPPSLTLDIGCGTGYWAIEAAKQWPNSSIIGFDLCHEQPRLCSMEHTRALSQRVKWVHGNLLDGLPFSPNHFDFVRMAGLGLAIPEDEWQPVLEEIYRVMKAGAVLEIIIEDLIFPCSLALIQKPRSPPSLSSVTRHLESLELYKQKSSTFSERSTSSLPKSPISMASLNFLAEDMKTICHTSKHRSSKQRSPYPSSDHSSPASTDSNLNSEHPQDHTRLKTSWDAMLSARFLSPKVVSIIPFYLTSSFVDTISHTPLVVPLPPNSGNLPSLQASSRSLGSLPNFFDVDFEFNDKLSKPLTPSWGTVHLAKVLSTINGCKEAVWNEYRKLYSNEALEILLRTAPIEEEYKGQLIQHLPRKAFEVDWRNWEYDMLDRISMRDSLSTHVPWIQATSDDEQPQCLTWRQKLDRKSGEKHGHLVAAYDPDDLCRSLRVFTSFKL